MSQNDKLNFNFNSSTYANVHSKNLNTSDNKVGYFPSTG